MGFYRPEQVFASKLQEENEFLRGTIEEMMKIANGPASRDLAATKRDCIRVWEIGRAAIKRRRR